MRKADIWYSGSFPSVNESMRDPHSSRVSGPPSRLRRMRSTVFTRLSLHLDGEFAPAFGALVFYRHPIVSLIITQFCQLAAAGPHKAPFEVEDVLSTRICVVRRGDGRHCRGLWDVRRETWDGA